MNHTICIIEYPVFIVAYGRNCTLETSNVPLEPIYCSLKTRNNFESTRQEVENLMRRIRSAEQDFKAPGQWTMEGFLYVQEKREYPPKHVRVTTNSQIIYLKIFV